MKKIENDREKIRKLCQLKLYKFIPLPVTVIENDANLCRYSLP